MARAVAEATTAASAATAEASVAARARVFDGAAGGARYAAAARDAAEARARADATDPRTTRELPPRGGVRPRAAPRGRAHFSPGAAGLVGTTANRSTGFMADQQAVGLALACCQQAHL
jgi:hypothetical protein